MNDPKELLLRWFDVGILAIVGIVSIFAVMSFFQADPTLEAQAQLIQSKTQTLEQMASLAKQNPPTTVGIDLADQLGAKIQMSKVQDGQAWPTWALERRPYLITSFLGPPPDLVPLHFAPGNVTIAASRGLVAVRWDENLQNKYVEVKGYEVQRKDSEAGEWTVIGRTTASEHEYVDKDVKPQSKYWYKVVSVAEVDKNHPRIRGFKGDVKLEDAEKIKPSDEAGPADTPRDVYLVPGYAQVPDPVKDPTGIKSASIKVYRWDAEKNAWIKPKLFPVKLGEEIGDIQKAIGSQPAIDRRAHAKLIDCGEAKIEEEIAGGTKVNRTYYWIEVEFEDGTKAKFDNLTIPDEIKDVK